MCRSLHVAPEIIEDTNEVAVKIGGHKLAQLPRFVLGLGSDVRTCGVNVGGHRTFRPTTLAEQLKHLDAVNIGAAGTFVIRRPVTRPQLRAELARRLPFDAEIMICPGREIVRLMSQNHFADQPVRPDIVRFVSVLSKRPR